VGLERGPLSLVSTIEELVEKKSSGSGLETEITVVGIRRADHATRPLSTKVGSNFTDKLRSVGIVYLRTQATGIEPGPLDL
jgi:hypothetical protein